MQKTVKQNGIGKILWVMIFSSGFYVGHISKDIWGLIISIISFIACSWIIEYFIFRLKMYYNKRHPDDLLV